MSWKQDLAFGQRYEKIALGLLGNGDVITPPEGVKWSPWDFKHNGVAFECKADRCAARTGNLCIEYEHTGIPSGISITEADEWFYFIHMPDSYVCYKIPVAAIKDRISQPGCRLWHTDGGNSRFYLVPAADFESYKYEKVKAA